MPELPYFLLNKGQAKTNFKFRSNEEKRMFEYVVNEVDDEIDYAIPWRREGQDAVKGYMATVAHSIRGKRSRSNYLAPIVHSMIYARNAVEAASGPKVKISFRKESNKPKAKWINAAIKASEMGYSNERAPADGLFFEQTFDKNLLGVGAIYTDYWFATGIADIYDPNARKWKKKTTILHDDIFEQVVDPMNFGVARGTKLGCIGCKKQYMDVFYSRDEFFKKRNTPMFFNIDGNIIPDADWFHGDVDIRYKPTVGRREVRERHFWDITNSIYFVMANGIPIRWSYILNYGNPNNPHPHCPISTIHNDYNYEETGTTHQFTTQGNRFYTSARSISTSKSFWSKGDARLVKPMVVVKNTFGRVAIDYLKAAGVHFVVGPTGIVDRVNRGRLYGIEAVQIDGNQSFDVKSLAAGSQFFSEYKLADDHFDMVSSFALGRDWRRVGLEKSDERATIAKIREGKEQRRDAQNARMNENAGIWLRYWIKYQLIQQYYVEPSRLEINDSDDIIEMEEENVERDAQGHVIRILFPKDIPTDFEVLRVRTKTGKKIKNAEGKDMDEMKWTLIDPQSPTGKQMIREQKVSPQNMFTASKSTLAIQEEPVIDIIPLGSFVQNQALEDAALVEKIQTIMPFLTMLYNGEPLIPKDGATYFVKHVASSLDRKLNTDKLLGLEEGREEEQESAPPGFLNTKTATAQQGLGDMIGGGEGAPPPVSQGNPTGTPSSPGRAVNQQSDLIKSITP